MRKHNETMNIYRRRLIYVIILILIVFSTFTACGTTVEKEYENAMSTFVEVEKTNIWCVVYHRETKVMYAVSRGSYNHGNFTLLVNADGSPMLWDD